MHFDGTHTNSTRLHKSGMFRVLAQVHDCGQGVQLHHIVIGPDKGVDELSLDFVLWRTVRTVGTPNHP
jgi:hypothetical protein